MRESCCLVETHKGEGSSLEEMKKDHKKVTRIKASKNVQDDRMDVHWMKEIRPKAHTMNLNKHA
jgi:hypothetical protein